jgi:hypothetical protein
VRFMRRDDIARYALENPTILREET